MGKEEDNIINEANAAELARVNAEDLSMEGEAGQSATPQQAARGEAADGEPLRTAGGVSEQLEEAADMGSADGLGAGAYKSPEEIAQEVSLAAAAARFCELAHKRFMTEQGLIKPEFMYDKPDQMIKQASKLADAVGAEERARLVYEARVRIEEAEEAGTR